MYLGRRRKRKEPPPPAPFLILLLRHFLAYAVDSSWQHNRGSQRLSERSVPPFPGRFLLGRRLLAVHPVPDGPAAGALRPGPARQDPALRRLPGGHGGVDGGRPHRSGGSRHLVSE